MAESARGVILKLLVLRVAVSPRQTPTQGGGPSLIRVVQRAPPPAPSDGHGPSLQKMHAQSKRRLHFRDSSSLMQCDVVGAPGPDCGGESTCMWVCGSQCVEGAEATRER